MKAKTVKPADIDASYESWSSPIEVSGGYSVRVKVDYDQDMCAPWKEHDGHGPVSEWTTRDKCPGERVLCTDRSSKRYYDFAEAVKLAKHDGWDAPPYNTGTPGERAARAAEADYENLRAWCNDEWHWICVAVEVSRNGEEIETDACGGIKDYGDYWREHAASSANDIIAGDRRKRKAAAIAARIEKREAGYWLDRGMVTA